MTKLSNTINSNNSMHTHLKLFQLARGVHGFFGTIVSLSLALAMIIIVQMYLLSRIVATVFMDETYPSLMLFVLLGVTIVARSALMWYRERYSQQKAIVIKSQLRSQIFECFLFGSSVAEKSSKTGEQVNLLMNGVEKLDDYFTRYIPSVVHIVILPVAISVFALYYDWLSGLIMLLTGPLILFFMFLIGTYAKSLTNQQWRQMSRLSSHFLDALQGLKTLKALGTNASELNKLDTSSKEFRLATMRVLQIAFLSGMVLELAASVSIAFVAVQIGIRLIEGMMVFQAGFFILLLAPEFYIPFRLLGQHHHAGMEGSAAANPIFSILNEKGLAKNASPKNEVEDDRRIIPEIQFRSVSYTYPESGIKALNQLNCLFRAGCRTALVGATGSGKSTIIQHILGQLQAQSGRIMISAPPPEGYTIGLNQLSIAYVAQHPYFFNGTILDNFLMAKRDASEQEILHASKKARIHDVIDQLPQKYNTLIHENASELSGGERQRLAIARAFLKNAPLVIFDEPTSSLDPESEQLLAEAMEELTQNKTTIIIAHRLQTIQKADHILVLNKGELAEEGSHADLIKSNGLYFKYLNDLDVKNRPL